MSWATPVGAQLSLQFFFARVVPSFVHDWNCLLERHFAGWVRSQTRHFFADAEQPNAGSHFALLISSTQREAPFDPHSVVPP
jgi:hypothetical protein